MIVAIDGPAGAGKSTVARGVARRLGLFFLDTGAMYRAVALVALKNGIDSSSEDALAGIARKIDLAFDEKGRILINGEPGEPDIRSEAVTSIVSGVSAHRGVRDAISAKQREIASKGGRAAHAKGTAHEWSAEEARRAGRKGGQASRGGRGKLPSVA